MQRPRLALGLDIALFACYSIAMKTSQTYLSYAVKRIVFIAIIVLVCAYLQACAYTVVSTASFVTTGKSVGDHVLTTAIPNADCTVTNLAKDKYYCEVTDISKTYNRWGI